MHVPAAASRTACSFACRRALPAISRMGSATALAGGIPRTASSEKLQALTGGSPFASSWRRPPQSPSPLQSASRGHDGISVTATALGSGGGGDGSFGASAGDRLRRSLSFGEWQRPLPWLRIPDELWGAINALSAAASPAAERPPRHGARSVATQARVAKQKAQRRLQRSCSNFVVLFI